MKLSDALGSLTYEIQKDGKSRSTLKTYRQHVRTYAEGLRDGRWKTPQGFIDAQSTQFNLSPKTIWQSLNALKFFYDRVLRRDLGKVQMPHKSSKDRRVPTCLSLDECLALFGQMKGVPLLQARLMFGAGVRVGEVVKLRIKDLDFSNSSLHVHGGKGDKDRRAVMPDSLKDELRAQMRNARRVWEADQRRGIKTPASHGSLKRKLGEAIETNWEWMWLFPSTAVRDGYRWHATPQGVNKAIKIAAKAAGITKRVSAHAMRHSFATAMIQGGTDIRTLQTLLGHAHINTTQIYLHALPVVKVVSPLDNPTPNIIPLPSPAAAQPVAAQL